MKIIEKKVKELIPYVNNPRNNEAAVDFVAASIKEFGFKNPIIIDKNGVIVAGHTRHAAAKKLGLESVPCIMADDLTEQQIKAFRLADNKTAELATWDLEKLEIELESIEDLEMTDFGFMNFDNQDESGETEEEELERKRREFAERMSAGEISEEDEEYQEFLQKFELKKTTDDCYTPPKVYDAVAKWVAKKYGVKVNKFIRPFYPGGDYTKETYPSDSVVVDNPPFSILSEILKFYSEKNIKFFLFAPALTLFSSSSSSSSTAICVGGGVVYENGAKVNTSFLTNLEDRRIRFKSEPELRELIDNAVSETLKEKNKTVPKYSYPLNVVTSPMLSQYSRYGIKFEVLVDESVPVSQLDSQKESKKAIYGKGYLIGSKKKAEREKAEREKAEREKAERWDLSDRELEIIKGIDQRVN